MPLPTVEMLEKQFEERAAAVQRVLASPDGALLMEALEEVFLYGKLLGSTEQETFANIGAREVVIYLRELRNHEREQNNG